MRNSTFIRINLQYILIQAAYWTAYCSIIGYFSVYMLATGVSNSYIGIVLACANGLAVFLQPTTAALLEKSARFTSRQFLLGGILVCIIGGIISQFGMPVYLRLILYGILIFCMLMIMPFINLLGAALSSPGASVNFGVARGVGSFSYAILSMVLGSLVVQLGTSVISKAMLIMCLLLFCACLFLGPRGGRASFVKPAKGAVQKNFIGFISSYKHFSFLLLGFTILFVCYSMCNSYIMPIVKSLGGDTGNFGKTIAFSAFIEIPTMFLFARVVKKISVKKLIMFSSICFTLKVSLFYIAGSVNMLYLAQFMQAFSYALFIPASVHYVDKYLEPHDRMKGQALMTTCVMAGTVGGTLLGGTLIDNAGIHNMLLIATLVSVAGTLIVVVSSIAKTRLKTSA